MSTYREVLHLTPPIVVGVKKDDTYVIEHTGPDGRVIGYHGRTPCGITPRIEDAHRSSNLCEKGMMAWLAKVAENLTVVIRKPEGVCTCSESCWGTLTTEQFVESTLVPSQD